MAINDNVNLGDDNTATFRAFHAKVTREYVPFLASLERRYSQGPVRVRVVSTLRKAAFLSTELERATRTSVITVKRADELLSEIRAVANEVADLLVEHNKTEDMRRDLNEAADDVGLSIDDLNITDAVLASARKDVRKRKPGGGGRFGFLKEAAGVVKDIGEGVATAAAGPFAPIAMLGLRAVGGLGKQVASSFRGSKRGSVSVSPGVGFGGAQYDGGGADSPSTPSTSGQQIAGALQRTGVGVSHESPGQVAFASGLSMFYNKGAYDAAYTQEMLATTQTIEKHLRGGGIGIGGDGGGGSKGSSLVLGAALGGLLGKGGKLVLFGMALAGATWGMGQILKLGEALAESRAVRELTIGVGEQAQDTIEQHRKGSMEAGGPHTFARNLGQTNREFTEKGGRLLQAAHRGKVAELEKEADVESRVAMAILSFFGAFKEPDEQESQDRYARGVGMTGFNAAQMEVLGDLRISEQAQGTSKEDISVLYNTLADRLMEQNRLATEILAETKKQTAGVTRTVRHEGTGRVQNDRDSGYPITYGK